MCCRQQALPVSPKIRKQRNNEVLHYTVPTILNLYNQKKVGVDRTDQLLKIYNPVRKNFR